MLSSDPQVQLDLDEGMGIGSGSRPPVDLREYEQLTTRDTGPTVATSEGRAALTEAATEEEAEAWGSYGAPEDDYDPHLDEFVRDYAAYADVPMEVARSRMRFQSNFKKVSLELRKRFPGRVFGGVLDLEQERGTMEFTGPAPDRSVADLSEQFDVEIDVMDGYVVTSSEYANITTQVMVSLRDRDIDVQTALMDPATGEVTVEVVGSVPALAEIQKRANYENVKVSRLSERIEVSPEVSVPLGGSKIFQDRDGFYTTQRYCSSAFAIRYDNGVSGQLTANHCGTGFDRVRASEEWPEFDAFPKSGWGGDPYGDIRTGISGRSS